MTIGKLEQQSAEIVIMNNIAEGFCRCSDKEFHQFLKFSKGSAGEIKNIYFVAEDLKYFPPDVCSDRRNSAQGLIYVVSCEL